MIRIVWMPEAYSGLGAVAVEAGISRESLLSRSRRHCAIAP